MMGLFDGRLGVMEGRLLPKYQKRYQAHPVGYWQDEFPKAAELGLQLIEFILDFNDSAMNPLLSDHGAEAIQKAAAKSGVAVRTVCADYFMEAPLHSIDPSVAAESDRVLTRLIGRAAILGITDIVIPCVDQSSLTDRDSVKRFCDRILPHAALAGSKRVNLSLETDLGPQEFAALLAEINSPHVTVNYDTGNSASLGFDPAEELAVYGKRISDIHIKDRVRGGGSVLLGSGDAKFGRFFEALAPLGYAGPFIMQVYRDDEGVRIFCQQMEWLTQRYGS